MSALTDHTAAFEIVANGSYGPEAEMVTKGGKQTFAAGELF
jgi:hypothetical protein